MSDSIRAAVSAILESAEVTFSAIYRGERKGALGGTHSMDKWDCAFTLRDGRAAHEEFEYFTGLGHRKPHASKMAKISARSLAKVSKRMLAWEQHYKKWPDQPQQPHAADVLHSLIMDASAAEQTFESWCNEYGYDTDSRKALATYEACQQNADKLRRVFSRDVLAQLAEALQDY